jgi:chemotaxis protein MotC
LSKAAPEVWQDPRNARAAVIFVLSGGNPSVLRQLLEHGVNPAVDIGLLKGALAYSEGRVAEADRLLSKFDARTLDPSLAGLIALVQAMLAEKKNNIRLASSRFDDARLLAPGTLVEESALRRQAFMMAADNKLEQFEVFSSQYFRRFGHCVYGIIFRREFGRTLAASKYVDDLNLLRRLEPVLDALNPDERQELYMVAAAEGIRRGKVAFTRYTAARAAALTPAGTPESWRVKLYENATPS